MSVNDKTCWTKTGINALNGEQLCGGIFKEETFRVTGCFVTLPASEEKVPMTVRVWTTLDGDADDESFGIDNVVVRAIQTGNPCSKIAVYAPFVVKHSMMLRSNY